MKLNYRPELDGLRALAVISVIVYHAKLSFFGKQLLTGGYLGVDIFFIISGYLISRIIFSEIKLNKFSFINFYERRIRRIIPALLVVIFFSSIFGLQFLMPKDYFDFSKSAISSILFFSNIYFFFTEVAYGAESGLLKPLLHTWSLGIEEQFYIFFPVLIFLIFRFVYRYLFQILFVIFILSLLFAHYGSLNFTILNFYSLHSRIWELILGSGLAYIELFKNNKKDSNKTYSNFISFSGFLIIVLSIIFFNEDTPHPSLMTLFPTIGVCLLIFSSNKQNFINKILSFRPVVFVGLISYSLYLWHFPIFAFSRIAEFTRGDFEKKIIIALVLFSVSILSYFFVEKPFRNRDLNFKKIFLFLVFVVFCKISFFSFALYKGGFSNRAPDIVKKNLEYFPSYSLLKDDFGILCDDKPDGCFFENKNTETIYAIGDSHLATIGFDLKNKLLKNNYNLKIYTIGGCAYFPGFDLIIRKTEKIHKYCNDDYFKKIRNELLSIKKTTIILHARWPIYFDNNYLASNFFTNIKSSPVGKKSISYYKPRIKNKHLKTELNKSILELLNYGHNVILIMPVPEVGYNVSRKIFANIPRNFDKRQIAEYLNNNKLTIPFKVYEFRSKSSFDFFKKIKHKNLTLIYPHKILCDEFTQKVCFTHDKENIFYDDNNHLSYFGSKMINNKIINLLKTK